MYFITQIYYINATKSSSEFINILIFDIIILKVIFRRALKWKPPKESI